MSILDDISSISTIQDSSIFDNLDFDLSEKIKDIKDRNPCPNKNVAVSSIDEHVGDNSQIATQKKINIPLTPTSLTHHSNSSNRSKSANINLKSRISKKTHFLENLNRLKREFSKRYIITKTTQLEFLLTCIVPEHHQLKYLFGSDQSEDNLFDLKRLCSKNFANRRLMLVCHWKLGKVIGAVWTGPARHKVRSGSEISNILAGTGQDSVINNKANVKNLQIKGKDNLEIDVADSSNKNVKDSQSKKNTNKTQQNSYHNND